ncbi:MULTISPECIES: Lrp/AsnC family transcriptional regulator [Metallosphaera]|uniref:Lrp/AsnC family transcriptional regulator n=1 Tax=Metallosphaera TaxID=41980 RepID=UPI001F06B35F|nr:Lrp/AsnC family transcriptional regulator [Metallosphaera sedula]MCH1771801.1 Lrp/AsnC family transcriptional regulator [Metallosphaera sedula]MCP6729130.1 Lrp/AsnC family transcriptional regulator [Metallosphaera sedula]
MDLADTQIKLLMELQYNFPLDEKPFDIVAGKLNLRTDLVLKETLNLIDSEIIKRVGMYVNFRSKGMEGALIAASIPLDQLDKFRREALHIRELTHNFIRNHPRYNVWYVLKAESKEVLEKRVRDLMEEVKAEDYVILFSKRNLKLSVKYDLIRGISWSKNEKTPEKIPTADELGLNMEFLKALSYPLPIVERPFKALAERFGYREAELVDLISELRSKHVIKDYGATVNGEKVGITENAMLLINTDNIEESCNRIAENLNEATHVVLRESNKPWDYLCYCMLHGRSKAVIREASMKALGITGAKSYMLLYSLDNLKPGIVM